MCHYLRHILSVRSVMLKDNRIFILLQEKGSDGLSDPAITLN